jgi:hypothetical protein
VAETEVIEPLEDQDGEVSLSVDLEAVDSAEEALVAVDSAVLEEEVLAVVEQEEVGNNSNLSVVNS